MKYVFLDTETTGLNDDACVITQLAAVAIDEKYNKLSEFERKFKFDVDDATVGALKVNSYDEDTWAKEAKDPNVCLREFSDWVGPYRCVKKKSRKGKPYFVAKAIAHNSPFDKGFVTKAYKRAGLFCPIDYLWLDTLQLALWKHRNSPLSSYRNAAIAELCGVDTSQAHDALADCHISIETLKFLMDGRPL